MTGKFKVIPKVCTTNINKESEQRQKRNIITYLIVLRPTNTHMHKKPNPKQLKNTTKGPKCLDWRGKMKPLFYLTRSTLLNNWFEGFIQLFERIYLWIFLLWKWSQVDNIQTRAKRLERVFESWLKCFTFDIGEIRMALLIPIK